MWRMVEGRRAVRELAGLALRSAVLCLAIAPAAPAGVDGDGPELAPPSEMPKDAKPAAPARPPGPEPPPPHASTSDPSARQEAAWHACTQKFRRLISFASYMMVCSSAGTQS